MHGVLGRIGQLSSVAYGDSSPHLGEKKREGQEKTLFGGEAE